MTVSYNIYASIGKIIFSCLSTIYKKKFSPFPEFYYLQDEDNKKNDFPLNNFVNKFIITNDITVLNLYCMSCQDSLVYTILIAILEQTAFFLEIIYLFMKQYSLVK